MDCFESLYCRYPLSGQSEKILTAFRLLIDCARANATVYTCGNGGSAADSEHIVGELMKGFCLQRKLSEREKSAFAQEDSHLADALQWGIRAVSLVSQTALISAFANDVAAEYAYAQQLYNYAQNENDVLIALSTSGNSENIVNAVKAANAKKIKSIAVTGSDGGKLAGLATVTVCLPSASTPVVQEYTVALYHTLCQALEKSVASLREQGRNKDETVPREIFF